MTQRPAFQKKSFVIPVMIAINIAVYLLWSLYPDKEFVALNFLTAWVFLQEGLYWTLLTAVFSHNAVWHLLLNMYVLNSFGGIVQATLGTWRFLAFYLVAGIFSSLSHCVVSNFLMHQPDLPALGASGAISAVIIFFSLVYRSDKILIFGIIPMPALWGALAFVGLDIWGLYAQTGGGGLPIGHGAHLGGAFVGMVYYFMVRNKLRAPRVSN